MELDLLTQLIVALKVAPDVKVGGCLAALELDGVALEEI